MRKLFLFLALFVGFTLAEDVFITVDQFGYRPSDQKVAVLRDPQSGADADLSYSPGSTMEVIDASTGKSVFSGAPVAFNEGAVDTASGDKVWWFDFSTVQTPGTYYVQDASDNSKKSFSFKIDENVYNNVLKAAVRMLFYQRLGIEKTAENAGEWSDSLCFAQDKEAHLYSAPTDDATIVDVSGGWFDAGDFNKYTVWNGNYIERLLEAYLDNPDAFGDNYNIPESGNGIPDVVDEAFFGIEHLLRMQKSDGSVLSVVGETSASPPSKSTAATLYGPPTALASYSAAKGFAIGAIVAKKLGKTDYAAKLTSAAESAFSWAEDHQDSVFYNNSTSQVPSSEGLAAGQQEIDPTDEGTTTTASRLIYRVNAAVSLYELTGTASYLKVFEDKLTTTVDNNAYFPLTRYWGAVDHYRNQQTQFFIRYLQLDGIDATLSKALKDRLLERFYADNSGNFVSTLGKDGYRAYLSDYNWGSNSSKSSNGMVYALMAQAGLTQNEGDSLKFMNAAEDYLHYLHGVNPFGMVYLSNMKSYGASKSVSSFYHAWFGYGTEWQNNPAPGYLVGGPNANYTWDSCCPNSCGSTSNNSICSSEWIPTSEPSEKFYKDFNRGWPLDSWSLTEPSLGYQTFYIRLVSKFVKVGSTTAIHRGSSLLNFQVKAKLVGSSLEITANESLKSVVLFNLMDQQVMQKTLSGKRANLSLQGLPPGMFFAHIKTANTETVKRIVIK